MPAMTELTRESLSKPPGSLEKPNFWSKFLNRKVSRRTVLKTAAMVGTGAALSPAIDTLETIAGIGKKLAEAAEITSLDELSEVNIPRETLEQNPQDVKAVTYVEDPVTKNITKKFAIVDTDKTGNSPKNVLYESHINTQTNKFTEYKAVSPKIDIQNPLSIVTSENGNTVIVGGEDPLRSGNVKLLISYDGGKTFKDIPWPSNYPVSGGTIDLVRINDTTYLGNNGNYEGGVGQFIISLDPQSQTSSIAQVNLETVQGVNINAGGATDFGVLSVDSQNNTLKAISAGTKNLEQGINIFNINYATRQGTVENIITVTMDGQANYNLGFVYGRGTYVDSQGHTHVKVSNVDRQLLFDIDLTTRTGTSRNYANLLNNKGIPNYILSSFRAWTVDVTTDSQGNRHTWLGGSYGSTIDGGDRAVLIHLESGNFYDLSPNRRSTMSEQNKMKRKKINGKSIYDLVVGYLGLATVEINSDGSPIPNAPINYPNKELGSEFFKYKAFIPVAIKQLMEGW